MPDVDSALLDRLAERLIRARGAVPAQTLAAELGCTRMRVAEAIEALDMYGAPLVETADGYTLALADPLDAEAISADLAQVSVSVILVRRVCASTNETVLALEPPALCVAEAQTAGRGRRGTEWTQSFGAGLALSIAAVAPRGRLDPLAIALALAVADCLESLGYPGIRIKWPNDLYACGAKLGGLMVELDGTTSGRLCLGLGLNVHAAPAVTGRETIALAELDGSAPERNRLIAALASALMAALRRYDADGFAPFTDEFAVRDELASRLVSLREGTERVTGIARGIDDSGALILDTRTGRRYCRSGEVSRVTWTEAA